MKKFLLLMLTTLILVACAKRERVLTNYEVLLSTKDTMHVNAWYYWCPCETFTDNRTYVFYDTQQIEVIRINNPIYIREAKKGETSYGKKGNYIQLNHNGE